MAYSAVTYYAFLTTSESSRLISPSEKMQTTARYFCFKHASLAK